MGLKKVSRLIEKINVLYDSLLSIDEEISSIEKDLLLNYIRQLYEQVLEIGTEGQEVKKPAKQPASMANEVMDLNKQDDIVVHPAVEEIADIEKEEIANMDMEEIPTEDTFKAPRNGMHTVNVNKANAEVEVLEKPITMKGLNEDLVAMFEMKEAKELSERLSSTPIKDLNSAMGINDRFLTVNELFGGDSNAFKECIDHINQMDSYEDAKSYLLAETAQTFDWSSAERLKKAAGFITLVQRRFR